MFILGNFSIESKTINKWVPRESNRDCHWGQSKGFAFNYIGFKICWLWRGKTIWAWKNDCLRRAILTLHCLFIGQKKSILSLPNTQKENHLCWLFGLKSQLETKRGKSRKVFKWRDSVFGDHWFIVEGLWLPRSFFGD